MERPRLQKEAKSHPSGLFHHARNTARFAPRRTHPVLEMAACRRTEIAGPHIGPGTAAAIGFARQKASAARRIGPDLEGAVVAAGAVNAVFPSRVARCNDTGPPDAGNAATILDPW